MIWLARRSGGSKHRGGHAPFLAEIRLFWCDDCNVPRISQTKCSLCGKESRRVQISPPGDPFPAMEGHLKRAKRVIDGQFGEGVADELLPPDKTVVMSKISALDSMYEIIVDGFVIARLRFDIPDLDYSLLLTLEGARRLTPVSKQKWVSSHDGILKFLKDGANLLMPGIGGCDSEIEVGDEVWVLNPDGEVIAVGTARMSGDEMAKAEKGYAIKIREAADPEPPKTNTVSASWDTAVIANQNDLDSIEDEAISFIKRTVQRTEATPVVGFSGGKDSLATYLVVEKALEYSPPLFFVDTGIEFPETVQYVREFAEDREVEVIGTKAGNHFWESVEVFGPPARDFRWCCKILKLGPAATAISEELDGESLSFMGQRKLESFQRSKEPRITSNPWVPGQIGANPIQNWNALEVWLYIFQEKAPFNSLYNMGYHRIGCYLCPSSPLEELRSLEETHPQEFERLSETLHDWANRLDYPKEWITYGFWRWKSLPSGQRKLVKRMDLSIKSERPSPSDTLDLSITKGISPCVTAPYSLEGQFSGGLDLTRVSNLLPIFGPTKISEEIGALRTKAKNGSINLFTSGSVVIRGEDEDSISKLTEMMNRAVKRAMFCQACGTCVAQCEHEALILKDDGIAVDEDKCVNCLQCDNWPCPTYLA